MQFHSIITYLTTNTVSFQILKDRIISCRCNIKVFSELRRCNFVRAEALKLSFTTLHLTSALYAFVGFYSHFLRKHNVTATITGCSLCKLSWTVKVKQKIALEEEHPKSQCLER